MRQDYYGHRFGDGSYTPEMVVDGMVGLVGSHRDEVNAAIEHAKRGQHTFFGDGPVASRDIHDVSAL
jgi:hypothetical protein